VVMLRNIFALEILNHHINIYFWLRN